MLYKRIIKALFTENLRKSGILYTDNQHFIRVMNLDTKEVSSFVVKRFERGSKEYNFCFYLKPGKYLILNYQFQKTTWYGEKIITTPIFKGVDYNDIVTGNLSSSSTHEIDRKPYFFTVKDDALNYLGTWDFSSGIVVFRNEKDQTNKELADTYSSLPFDSAAISIPN